MSGIQEAIELIPGFSIAQIAGEEYALKHFQTTDPYEDKDGNRRRLPPTASKQRQKLWRQVQKRAWVHDKCFLGSCGMGLDCGVGLVPIVVGLFPVLGPLVMYAMHTRLTDLVAEQVLIPPKVEAKLHLNIVFDLLITFPPVIGLFFGWLNKCSTRNASILYDFLCSLEEEKANVPGYSGRGALVHEELFGYHAPPQPQYTQPPPGPPRQKPAYQQQLRLVALPFIDDDDAYDTYQVPQLAYGGGYPPLATTYEGTTTYQGYQQPLTFAHGGYQPLAQPLVPKKARRKPGLSPQIHVGEQQEMGWI